MPVRKVKQLTAWSYSRYSDWRTCPKKAFFKHIQRIKEPSNKAMERGSAIHKEAEDYAGKRTAKRPASLNRFKDEFKHLRKISKHLMLERSATVDRNWEETEWDNWAKAWLRAKFDVCYVDPEDPTILVIIDHKTGRMRPDQHGEQLDLYAALGFKLFSEVQTIRAEMWYLDDGEVLPRGYWRKIDADRLVKLWEKNVKPMMADKTFRATPSNACSWCFYSKAKGGPCEF